MKKKWVPVNDYIGIYEISNHGDIKICHKNRVMKPVIKSTGYLQVTLSKNSGQVTRLLHILVAKHFIPNPHNKPQVNHMDGDKSNPRANNLEWVTASENGKHAYSELGLIAWNKGKRGKDVINLCKPVLQKTLDGDLVKAWVSGFEAQRNGYDSGAICRCCKGIYKFHKGYIWEYA